MVTAENNNNDEDECEEWEPDGTTLSFADVLAANAAFTQQTR